ncbi:3-hydroxybutyrate dehydrogenase [Brevibacillus reuszeri]|uniref:3-hydroxybutyrate dehydrogenase n=1 Tax=Brevibacillus reuszeri TaxID=54915 RepID=A0A0K9Z1S3_9BACL|nr:3-hydroxybutyrate dehydrogenase [Brevibacillus reuszeri]KNB74852.1 3-hydroxybutyrate dehydrogenase [Brevibacillus reuszeri]MED1859498.1 3-hydroxybutyrate dehydrogenase [Brevibacillus reuszeri]GED72002.1 3-hydroxybutyrate dehydrogenase [Brevibacillus reuszeri]
MKKLLEQQVALVTGAASGIGLEIARTFAEEGAKVMIVDLNRDAADAAASRLQNEGYEVVSFACDVTNEEQVIEGMEQVVKIFGRLDILVNNAGLQFVSPIEDFPTAKFEQMISIMLTAPFVAIKHAFPIMKKQGFGRVLNMASINGLIGFAGKAAYNSAKHGVIGLTKVAALEGAAHGITVNAICPGYVDTPLVQNQLIDLAKTRNVPLEKVMEEVIYPLVPQKRLLNVQEVADYAVFLASKKAQGVTGQGVVIDGGYTAQ